jgi:rhamnulokinase
LPFHYRDIRTRGQLARAVRMVGPGAIYRSTGIQELELNTLFQILSERDGSAYAAASQLLMIPDLLVYFLTGEKRFERTIASTTQLVDARTGKLAEAMMSVLGVRTDLFPRPVEPGEVVGPQFLTSQIVPRSARPCRSSPSRLMTRPQLCSRFRLRSRISLT